VTFFITARFIFSSWKGLWLIVRYYSSFQFVFFKHVSDVIKFLPKFSYWILSMLIWLITSILYIWQFHICICCRDLNDTWPIQFKIGIFIFESSSNHCLVYSAIKMFLQSVSCRYLKIIFHYWPRPIQFIFHYFPIISDNLLSYRLGNISSMNFWLNLLWPIIILHSSPN
jgi:hypothetical protein